MFIRDSLTGSGVRLDGRGLEDFRRLTISLTRSETNARSEVTLGLTHVITVVSGHIVSPYLDRPNEGYLHFNTELSSQSSSSISHAEISRSLERIIRDSKSIDTESLCIVSGEKVWEIRVEVLVLDAAGGNILDAAILSAMSALRAFRKPDISVLETEVIDRQHSRSTIYIHHSDDREPLPLALVHTPLAVTLGVFKKSLPVNSGSTGGAAVVGALEASSSDDRFIFVLDPSAEEEKVMDGRITYSLNAHKELCAVSKPGGVAMPIQSMMRAAQICYKNVTVLQKALNDALNELEAQVLIDREARRDLARQLREVLNNAAASDENDSNKMQVDNNTEIASEAAEGVAGIDRNDPILAWSNLHNPVAIRESKVPV